MIYAKNITKYFGSKLALNNVSFHIPKGEIVGFLGANGAGKTTLMRILTSYLKPTSGKASVAGFDLSKNALSARRKIGYLPESPALYTDMSVFDFLKFAAELKDIPAKNITRQIDKMLEQCQLRDVKYSPIGVLSKGYKQRVGIAQAIIHDPDVIILDEPTSGLDPLQILQVRELIRELEDEKTVILSTHILSEIEQTANRILIIQNGNLIKDASLAELLRDYANLEDAFLKLTARHSLEHAV